MLVHGFVLCVHGKVLMKFLNVSPVLLVLGAGELLPPSSGSWLCPWHLTSTPHWQTAHFQG